MDKGGAKAEGGTPAPRGVSALRMCACPSSSQDRILLPASLPTHLASFFLRFRFAFCRQQCAFIDYIYLLIKDK